MCPDDAVRSVTKENMRDWRNEQNVELTKLRRTDDLRTRLPLTNVTMEPKEDGQRNTLQIGPEGCWMVSRSRHDKTKGVEHSKSLPFVVEAVQPWMQEISDKTPRVIVFDGEFETLVDSTSAEVSRLGTEKKFVVWDVLRIDEMDCRLLPLETRREYARVLVEEIGHERLPVLRGIDFPVFGLNELEAALATIQAIRESGKKCEGFVVKELSRAYDLNWMGWKIKREDSHDGFIVEAREEKKHAMGKVTRTGRVGSVGCAQVGSDGKVQTVAWVALAEEDRCLLADWKSKLYGRVLSFKAFDWTGKLYSWPSFITFRTDKSPDQCLREDE